MIASYSICFILTVVCVGIFRQYALKKGVMDVPNSRSSHSVPTPRGGGIVAVIVFFFGLFFFFFQLENFLSLKQLLAFLFGSMLVAGIGFLDDLKPLAARWRFSTHVISAFLVLVIIGQLPIFPIFGNTVDLGLWAYPFFVFAIAWLLNLFNFMDGIDGIAGVEAVSVLMGSAFILFLGDEVVWAQVLFLLAVCTSGFLLWNWPPAKIFMGDACSGFLGFILGAFAVVTSLTSAINIWAWVILLGVFFVDATFTLIRRLLRGDKFYEAHRSHAYQRMSRRLGAHKPVTLWVLKVNMLWLFPWALMASLFPGPAVLFTILALSPVVYWVAKEGAGLPD